MFQSFRLLPFLAVLFLVCLPGQRADAQFEHQLVRRLVVFPVKSEKGLEDVSDDAWWQARDEFTKSRRFLVASKQFLIKSDVFQARGDLDPADSILLGKLLDAHALVTYQLNGRRLTMTVYDGGNGVTLYRKSFGLHPSLEVGDQLGPLIRRVVNDFIASVPYQGFTIVDSLVGSPVFTQGDAKEVKIDIGIGNESQIGDIVQWVRLSSSGDQPLFLGGAKMTAIAEGRIIKVEEGIATAEVLRATSLKEIREYSLVKIPREAERLRTLYVLSEKPRATLTAELVSPEAEPMQEIARERKPLLTTLSFVGSLAAFLLLVF